MKNYKVWRSPQDGVVGVVVDDGKSLTNLVHIVKHSPTGFEYGYGESGPSDLALSILADYYGEDSKTALVGQSLNHYQDFKKEFIQNRNRNEWFVISQSEITDWLLRREFPGEQGK